MNSKSLLCLLFVSLIIGCSSSEPTNIADGLSTSEVEDYEALMAAEAEKMGAAEDFID